VTLPLVPDDPVVSVLLLIILVETGLLVAVVRSILRGELVPGPERDHWRAAFFEQQGQSTELLVTGKAAREMFRALPAPDEETAS
jgi:hypothetical protein